MHTTFTRAQLENHCAEQQLVINSLLKVIADMEVALKNAGLTVVPTSTKDHVVLTTIKQ